MLIIISYLKEHIATGHKSYCIHDGGLKCAFKTKASDYHALSYDNAVYSRQYLRKVTVMTCYIHTDKIWWNDVLSRSQSSDSRIWSENLWTFKETKAAIFYGTTHGTIFIVCNFESYFYHKIIIITFLASEFVRIIWFKNKIFCVYVL